MVFLSDENTLHEAMQLPAATSVPGLALGRKVQACGDDLLIVICTLRDNTSRFQDEFCKLDQ